MSYFGDWREAAAQSEAARAAHPDCTEARDCPADGHMLTCLRWMTDSRTGLRGVVVGTARHVHAYDGKKTKRSTRPEARPTPRTVCGQVFDAEVAAWDEEVRTPRCAKCVKLLDAS